jgi:hypothetical protein
MIRSFPRFGNIHLSVAGLVFRYDEPIDHKAGQHRYREALLYKLYFGDAVRIILHR